MVRQISVEEYQFPEFGALVRVHVNLEGAAGLSEDALIEALVKHFTLEINDQYLADGGHALQRVPGLEHALKDLAPDARAPGPLPCDFSVDALRACVRNSVEARLTNTDGVTGTLSERVTHRGITRLLRYVSVLRAAHPSFARHKRGRLPRTREDHTQLDELRSALRRRDWTRARAILERTGALAAGAARVSLVSPEEEDEEEDGEAEEAFSSGGVDGGRPYRLHLETEDLMRALRWRAEPTDAETLGPVAQVKRKAGDERCVPRDIMLALLAAGGRKVLEDVDWGEYVRSKLENETGDARPAEEDEEDAPRAAIPLHAAVAHPAHPPEVLRFILELSPIQLLRAKYPSRDTALHALLADVGAKRNVEMRRKPWREGLAAKVDVFVKAAAAAGLAGAVVRARNRDGETPVHVAARALNPHGPGGRAHCGPVNEDEAGAVMRKLLEDDPEAALCVDAGGRTPLLVAVCKCDSTSLGVVSVLLARAPRAATMTDAPDGPETGVGFLGFQLPLQAELDKPHVKPAVVRALVRRGDDCAVKLDCIRRSPLHALLAEASRVGQDGARRTWPRRDEPRMSFFHRRGEVFRSLVRDFLARDVAYPSVDGPLGQRHPAAETVLAIRDSSGRTPLMYAVRHPEATVQMLKKLIAAHPAALDVADDEGNLPLHVAAGTGEKDPFALILRHRPDHIRARNTQGLLPLHVVAGNPLTSDLCFNAVVAADWGAAARGGADGRLPLHHLVALLSNPTPGGPGDEPAPNDAARLAHRVRVLVRMYPEAIHVADAHGKQPADYLPDGSVARVLLNARRPGPGEPPVFAGNARNNYGPGGPGAPGGRAARDASEGGYDASEGGYEDARARLRSLEAWERELTRNAEGPGTLPPNGSSAPAGGVAVAVPYRVGGFEDIPDGDLDDAVRQIQRVAATLESESALRPAEEAVLADRPEWACPIGLSLFREPVLAADGKMYERAKIQRWLQVNRPSGPLRTWKSPATGVEVSDRTLRAMPELTKEIDAAVLAKSTEMRETAERDAARARDADDGGGDARDENADGAAANAAEAGGRGGRGAEQAEPSEEAPRAKRPRTRAPARRQP